MPLISIIIPVYKAERFIHKCLDSILAQTYSEWEAILVDDGSPDSSGGICDKYAARDKRFKVIHQKNGGVVNARNNGIKSTNGEYLAFIDSDDYIENNMLEEMVSLAVKKQLDIVWCDIASVEYNNQTNISTMRFSNNENAISRLLAGELALGSLCNKLIRKSFWEKCNIKTDSDCIICEDTYITIQLCSNNPKSGYINKPYYYYNKTNEDSATSQKNHSLYTKAEKNIINIYEYLYENSLIDKYSKEFTKMAMRLKIELLRSNIDKAYDLFPDYHKRISNFYFPSTTSIFYWILFNIGFIGKHLFKLYFFCK